MGLITITGASTSWDLITLDDIPASLKGTNSSNEPRIATLISRVSRTIPRYLGRILARQTYREDVPGYGDVTLQVMVTQTSDGLFPGGPLSSVASVYLLSDENSTSNATASTDYQIQNRMLGELYKSDRWDWTAQTRQNLDSYIVPGSERPLWRVTYTAGFTLPRIGVQSQTQEGNLPLDIRQAAVDTVSLWFQREQRDPTVASYRMGDVTINYNVGSASNSRAKTYGLTDSAAEALEPWVRIAW